MELRKHRVFTLLQRMQFMGVHTYAAELFHIFEARCVDLQELHFLEHIFELTLQSPGVCEPLITGESLLTTTCQTVRP